MATHEEYIRALEKRSPRIQAEIDALREATPDELAHLKQVNPALFSDRPTED